MKYWHFFYSNYSDISSAASTSSAILDDTKRKVEEENKKYRTKSDLENNPCFKFFSHSYRLVNKRFLPPPPPPAQNTVLPPAIPAKPQQSLIQDSSSFTIAVYSFCDEDVPYRIKLPGNTPPTLKQFKDNLPKKGNYRYNPHYESKFIYYNRKFFFFRFFFKTRCDDIDSPVIQEEINNDSDVLPFFEGKVMGTVKSAE